MKRRTVKNLKWLGIVTVVLAAGYAILAIAANASLKRAYAALEADGRPIEFEDIIPPEVPDSDNAALVYRRVVLQLKAEKAENGEEKSLWDALTEALAEAKKQANPDAPAPELVARFLQLYGHPAVTDALAELEAGSQKSGCWNNLDFTKGFSLALPHVWEHMSLTEIICASARIRSAAGDHAGAWNSALTALRVANALKHEPVLISQIARSAQFGTVVDAIQDLPYNAATHAEADALLAAGENSAPWALALDGERIFAGEAAFGVSNSFRGREMISTLEHIVGGESRQSQIGLLPYVLVGPLSRFDQAAHIAMTDAMAREMLGPYSVEGTAAIQQLQEDLPWYCVVSRIMTPTIGKVRIKQVELIAQIRVTRAGLTVLQHHEEQGTWPDALPKEPDLVDPFTGEPLIFQPASNGFVLYSVGANLVDDKGTPGKENTGDIVWRYSADPR